ncbi:MAG: imidazolonepropionase [Flavobacteriales bacterium]|nr:imidazolonepropionase [Flavobacteriales bacterium]
MKTIIKNISELIQTETSKVDFVSGKDMQNINTIKDAFLEITDGLISNFGSMDEWAGIDDWINTNIIDADGGMVFPTYCDSHTHLVFAKSRESEFIDRIKGLSYQEIADNGGGILNSVEKLRNTSEEKLFADAKIRLDNIIKLGTGAVEIKSGYGLSIESELKILRVIKRLKKCSEITIKSTFLAAHAIPNEFENNKEGYLDLIIADMLPKVIDENLADYIDIFCEKDYFTNDDTNKLLSAANKYGLRAKTHVNQFNSIGGVETSVRNNALSVDHLEIMKENDIDVLMRTSCMPTILPSCSFFLGIPYSPARKMIDKGLPIALATDFNPGSSPSGNMNFVSSLGCIKLKMTPEEVINATTINSAYAMGVERELGSIALGKKANFFITKEIPSYSYLHYSFGENLIESVYLNGKKQ